MLIIPTGQLKRNTPDEVDSSGAMDCVLQFPVGVGVLFRRHTACDTSHGHGLLGISV